MNCPQCQHEVIDGSKFCPNCAAPLGGGASVAKANVTSDFLLCLLLGWLGVHRFAKGQIGMGIFMFLTLGGFGVIWLFDLISIATGKPLALSTPSQPKARKKNADQCAYGTCSNPRDTQFLDSCSEEHQILAKESRRQEMERRNKAMESYSPSSSSVGSRTGQGAIVCPFCQQSGGVTVRTKEANSSLRRAAWSAATGGVGGEYHKILSCNKCGQKMDLGKQGPFRV